uniref:Phage tail assembly chaperone n=2 Tax=Viruses TaxID=10239 RepID=E7EKQ3_9CAUD|nr:phage tail assembly chaperone [Edwardsiella phage eiAU]ADV36462.1 phage tail assembly chaperone gp38 [Edwardsiella phage eiDWF]
MKYFKDSKNMVYAYLADGSQDHYIKEGLMPISETEAMALANPPPTQEELITQALDKKNTLLEEARKTTNDWQTELSLGIISDGDKAKLVEWMGYIKKLREINPASYPDIQWPTTPPV